MTRFTARIDTIIAGEIVRSDEPYAFVVQQGGHKNGTRWETAVDPLMEVGARYLLFLQGPQQGSFPFYWTSALHRFDVVNGRLVAFDWQGEPAGTQIAERLSGLTIDEATTRIEAARTATPAP